jgi:DNA topoisomerase IB
MGRLGGLMQLSDRTAASRKRQRAGTKSTDTAAAASRSSSSVATDAADDTSMAETAAADLAKLREVSTHTYIHMTTLQCALHCSGYILQSV